MANAGSFINRAIARRRNRVYLTVFTLTALLGTPALTDAARAFGG